MYIFKWRIIIIFTTNTSSIMYGSFVVVFISISDKISIHNRTYKLHGLPMYSFPIFLISLSLSNF